MPQAKDSSLISVGIGSRVREKDGRKRIGVIEAVQLTPNGLLDQQLVALVRVRFDADNRRKVTASTNLEPVPDDDYPEFYPSTFLFEAD